MTRLYLNAIGGISILMYVMVLFITPAGASIKPKPVDGLMEMFENFNELEEEFRDNKWNEAEEVVRAIEKDYKNMVNELKAGTDPKVIHKFGFVLGSFKKSLAKKDQEVLEKPFMMIQDLFLDIMENYDYPNAPVLNVLNRWLDESKEYLESDKYDDIAEEMEEIEHFKDRTMQSVNGNRELLTNFFEQAEKAHQLAALDKKDKENLEKTLHKMTSIISRLMK